MEIKFSGIGLVYEEIRQVQLVLTRVASLLHPVTRKGGLVSVASCALVVEASKREDKILFDSFPIFLLDKVSSLTTIDSIVSSWLSQIK